MVARAVDSYVIRRYPLFWEHFFSPVFLRYAPLHTRVSDYLTAVFNLGGALPSSIQAVVRLFFLLFLLFLFFFFVFSFSFFFSPLGRFGRALHTRSL